MGMHGMDMMRGTRASRAVGSARLVYVHAVGRKRRKRVEEAIGARVFVVDALRVGLSFQGVFRLRGVEAGNNKD